MDTTTPTRSTAPPPSPMLGPAGTRATIAAASNTAPSVGASPRACAAAGRRKPGGRARSSYFSRAASRWRPADLLWRVLPSTSAPTTRWRPLACCSCCRCCLCSLTASSSRDGVARAAARRLAASTWMVVLLLPVVGLAGTGLLLVLQWAGLAVPRRGRWTALLVPGLLPWPLRRRKASRQRHRTRTPTLTALLGMNTNMGTGPGRGMARRCSRIPLFLVLA